MSVPGSKLLDAAKSARREAVLIAPFVKHQSLIRLLSALPSPVSTVIVARWIPAEIAAGVCDLEIFDVVSQRPGASLYVHPHLHAKLYRFDDVPYVGSANLTDKALGWVVPGNIEILLDARSHGPELKTFETLLINGARQVDRTYRDQMKSAVDAFAGAPSAAALMESELYQVPATWLPRCAAPDKMWFVYADPNTQRLVQGAIEAAKTDLSALGLPQGLSQQQFRQQISLVLAGMPIVQIIDAASREGLSAAKAVDLLETFSLNSPLPYDAATTWEVLQKWLYFFFPSKYREEAVDSIFKQGRVF